MTTLKGTAAAVLAFVVCPCHLPLTLPLLLTLTGGSALGLWLASNQLLVWLASTGLFLGGLLLAWYWFTRPTAGAQCETPAAQGIRSSRRVVIKE
jgi:hypothetical protein